MIEVPARKSDTWRPQVQHTLIWTSFTSEGWRYQLLDYGENLKGPYQIAHDDLRLSIPGGWTAWHCALCRHSLSNSCVLLDTSYWSRRSCFGSSSCATTSAPAAASGLATGAENFIKALI